jgi:hypothetical protein
MQRKVPATDILEKYYKKILDASDKPLFSEAVHASKGGASRAAYIMIWLACAESLKRRFNVAQQRDNEAGKIVGKLNNLEHEHKSIDKVLLEESKKYGFISDSEYTPLLHIYEMRCIYGHPYEQEPSQEQLIHAASTVVDFVLSRPVTLKESFAQSLVKNMISDVTYIDNDSETVSEYARNILPRIDSKIYGWMLDKYLTGLEPLANDPSQRILFLRGIYFCRTMLETYGDTIYSKEEWHNKVLKYKHSLSIICILRSIFSKIGKLAQDSIVLFLFQEAEKTPACLNRLEALLNSGQLNKRQTETFEKHIIELGINVVNTNLSIKTCYDLIIKLLRSYTWPKQNPAIIFILNSGPEQINELDEAQQVNLGRNVFQTADGEERRARRFINDLHESINEWPYSFLKGLILESFINNDNIIRFKNRKIEGLLRAFDVLEQTKRNTLMREVINQVKTGKFADNIMKENINDIGAIAETYSWTSCLIQEINKKFEEQDK